MSQPAENVEVEQETEEVVSNPVQTQSKPRLSNFTLTMLQDFQWKTKAPT